MANANDNMLWDLKRLGYHLKNLSLSKRSLETAGMLAVHPGPRIINLTTLLVQAGSGAS